LKVSAAVTVFCNNGNPYTPVRHQNVGHLKAETVIRL
jgi:hypothetical protein